MTNAEWCIQNGIKFSSLYANYSRETYSWIIRSCYFGSRYYDIDSGINTMGEYQAILMWLDMEHKEPILDDAERRYLKAVIKPWRDKVDFIFKSQYEHDLNKNTIWDLLHIMCTEGNRSWDIVFPTFDESQMFKGMRPGKHYELEELGL